MVSHQFLDQLISKICECPHFSSIIIHLKLLRCDPLKPQGSRLDTVTDFLIKLGIKPCMHLLEIGIFSLNDVIARGTNYEQSQQKLGTFLENKVL